MEAPVRIGRRDPAKLVLEWPGGDVVEIPAVRLRRACPCAVCVDEHTGRPLLDPRTVADDLEHVEVRLVGRYALGIRFADGHSTGIFTWDRLRTLGAAGERPE